MDPVDPLAGGTVVNLAGGAAVLALGLFLLRARPRSRPAGLFAAYALLAGLFAVGSNGLRLVDAASGPLARQGPLEAGLDALAPLSALALMAFAWHFPRPPVLGRRRRIALGAAATGYAAVVTLVVLSSGAGGPGPAPSLLGFMTTWYGLGVASLWLARRYVDPDLSDDERRGVAIVAGVVGLYWTVAFSAGLVNFASAPARGFPEAFVVASLVRAWSPLLLGAAWLAATAQAPEGARRAARNMVFVVLGAMAFVAAKEAAAVGFTGEIGATRLILAFVIGHQVLRGQLPGIDGRVRWGLSRGATAAVFVAAFFVVSEGAQVVLGEWLRSEYLGILAAGALVFAITPLQQLSDRFAQRIAPDAGPGLLAGPERDREEAYRRAVRLARRGGLEPAEERDLAALADQLGLTSTRALELREALRRGPAA